ncbi:MAG: hypothetical protein VZR76_01605 [Candidatus Enteromonas sp.]|jgi:hypothetical protein|nr:hypothetical protein [Bacilli bacterium]MBQ4182010.1 hypothetical protein [Bacilli bacterium]MEE3298834.1 hypothetical protein [Candidatus Enteromonas sp.]MEE3401696.1 hypothetical protein [Candidatus Enteromonas sp.]MEE3464488.1 hypothetical protein [Candidatus Enteromonas sp.]
MMKDKLVKTGHKKLYHRFFRGLRVTAFALGLMAVGAIPVLATLTSVTQAKAKAEETPVVVEESEDEVEEIYSAPIEE